MTDLDIIKECRQTGRTRTTTKKLLEKAYETPMTKNEEEIEKVKAEIKMLQSKLSFLEELSQKTTPCEEAYKEVYGYYPMTDVGDASWEYFQNGYEQAQKEYQTLAEETTQEPEEEPKEEPKTLYQTLCDSGWNEWSANDACDIVKEWIYQYDCDYAKNDDYLEGYQECQTVLEERLRGLND